MKPSTRSLSIVSCGNSSSGSVCNTFCSTSWSSTAPWAKNSASSMDRQTVDIYERRATEWAAARPARHPERAAQVGGDALAGLPRIDLGCGHGPYLSTLGDPVVGIDASPALLALARREHPSA